jgi:CPA1 family monovalent cation:H+ antiporter
VPLSWQHVLNWGGLRGVIPLVLVYSLPETFAFRELLISYTLFTFIYSLLVHGLSIRRLLTILKLHLPTKTELIIQEENNLLEIEDSLAKLTQLKNDDEFDHQSKKELKQKLTNQAKKHERKLLQLANPEQLATSLKLQALQIERNTLQTLFTQGHITEATVLEFEGELDLQQDALEYPEVFAGRGFTSGGKVSPRLSLRKQLSYLRKILTEYPALSKLIRSSKQQVITARLQLLKARIISSDEVVRYLNHIRHLFQENDQALEIISRVKGEHLKLKRDNADELRALFADYPQMTARYQKTLLQKLVLNSFE